MVSPTNKEIIYLKSLFGLVGMVVIVSAHNESLARSLHLQA